MYKQYIKVLFIDIIPAVLAIIFLALRTPASLHKTFGLALAFISLIFWIKAFRDLGTSFTTTPKARRVVTKGLYSVMRHPMYFFGILVFLGLAMALNHPYAYLAVILVAILQLARSLREEQVLRDKFEIEYGKYSKNVNI